MGDWEIGRIANCQLSQVNCKVRRPEMVDLCLRWLVATHPTTIDYQLSTINY
ncbi:MAG: hypothetical protein HC942_21340, partial [Microcoleus sp. SU_5_6]|nr:hypothetical protein [Microcoleus sp. SU_5_6]